MTNHLARRAAPAAAVVAATTLACAVVSAAEPGGAASTIGFALAFCYFACLSASAWSRRHATRIRDSVPGLLLPTVGYAAAIPASAAAPLAAFDALVPAIGPFAAPVSILAGMLAVLLVMLGARALDLMIDPVGPPATSRDGVATRDAEPLEELP